MVGIQLPGRCCSDLDHIELAITLIDRKEDEPPRQLVCAGVFRGIVHAIGLERRGEEPACVKRHEVPAKINVLEQGVRSFAV